MPRLVDPLRMKSGSTDITIATTDGLFGGVASLPSTVAHTLVSTTDVQSLTGKTINNITITDPTSDAAGTLTIADGGTLATAGAFQHKFTSTAASAVTLPGATDALLMWTTETVGKITAKTSQINPLANVTWPTTGAQTLVNTTDAQTLENKTVGTGFAFSAAAGTSDATIPNYGLTIIAATTSPFTATLAAPVAGVPKYIHVSAANTTDLVTIVASTAVQFGVIDTTDALRTLIFSRPGTVSLLGITTSKWDVLSIGTTAAGTTALPTFTT